MGRFPGIILRASCSQSLTHIEVPYEIASSCFLVFFALSGMLLFWGLIIMYRLPEGVI